MLSRRRVYRATDIAKIRMITARRRADVLRFSAALCGDRIHVGMICMPMRAVDRLITLALSGDPQSSSLPEPVP